jgi:hypothetical protein
MRIDDMQCERIKSVPWFCDAPADRRRSLRVRGDLAT